MERKGWWYSKSVTSWVVIEGCNRHFVTYFYNIDPDNVCVQINDFGSTTEYHVSVFPRRVPGSSSDLKNFEFKTDSLDDARFKSIVIAKSLGWDIKEEDLTSWQNRLLPESVFIRNTMYFQ